jgi:methylated-DNA-protein-cysteine methyltransferase related protein
MAEQAKLKTKILNCVKLIPEQKVVYFGMIADTVGTLGRTVGWVLSGITKEEMNQAPWYRVVAKNGYISSLKLGAKGVKQRNILQKQNYQLQNDHVNMQQHLLSYSEWFELVKAM